MWTRRQFALFAALASCAIAADGKRGSTTSIRAAAIVFESHLLASRRFAIAHLAKGGVAIDLDRDSVRQTLQNAPDSMLHGFAEVIAYTQAAAFAILEPAAIHQELYLHGRPSLNRFENTRLVRWRLTTRRRDG